MKVHTIAVAVALLGAAAAPARGQGTQHAHHHHHHHVPEPREAAAVARFAEEARAATARYHDRAAAIADGFRLLGPDFPAMGEHWVHPGRMVDGTLDVARPQALSYATIEGRPVLIGVIYARPLHPGETAPDFPVAGYPWHDHVGAIDEESVLLHHVPTDAGDGSGVRLAMLHAWVWTDNPDGVFAADNWALPFRRAGLDVPERIDPAAARALSLLSGGDGYYRLLFRALVAPTPGELAHAQEAIGRARARVQQWRSRHAGDTTGTSEMEALEVVWRELWTEIGGSIDPAAAARLRLLLDP